MKSPQKTITNCLKTTALAVLTLFVVAGPAVAANDEATPQTYTWSAELVAFDKATLTATVRSYVVGHGKLDLTNLKEGDTAILTWSGAFSAASGVRTIAAGTMAKDRFTMPVEFVSTERDNRYVTFRVQIPAEHAAAIEALEPGQWVTATSAHAPADVKSTVSAIRSYTDVS